jgi:cytochrome c-type biogenesis protein CcmH/NrfG
MATTIGSLGEPPSPRPNPSYEEWIIRISQLQETLAVGPAEIAARSELATLLEQLDQPEEALLNWNAILASNHNNLNARERVARCRRRMGRPLKSNRSNR